MSCVKIQGSRDLIAEFCSDVYIEDRKKMKIADFGTFLSSTLFVTKGAGEGKTR